MSRSFRSAEAGSVRAAGKPTGTGLSWSLSSVSGFRTNGPGRERKQPMRRPTGGSPRHEHYPEPKTTARGTLRDQPSHGECKTGVGITKHRQHRRGSGQSPGVPRAPPKGTRTAPNFRTSPEDIFARPDSRAPTPRPLREGSARPQSGRPGEEYAAAGTNLKCTYKNTQHRENRTRFGQSLI